MLPDLKPIQKLPDMEIGTSPEYIAARHDCQSGSTGLRWQKAQGSGGKGISAHMDLFRNSAPISCYANGYWRSLSLYLSVSKDGTTTLSIIDSRGGLLASCVNKVECNHRGDGGQYFGAQATLTATGARLKFSESTESGNTSAARTGSYSCEAVFPVF